MSDDKQHDEQRDDEGITVRVREGVRLPKSIADRMAPASVWLVHAAAGWIILHGLANFVAIVRKSL